MTKSPLLKDLPEDRQGGRQRIWKTVSWESCCLASELAFETCIS